MPNLQELRNQVAVLRETKGQEQATLDLITTAINQAETEQSWEDLAHLYFEQHLVYQHLVMSQRDSDHPDQSIISDNLDNMLTATIKAKGIIESHNLTALEGDLHRFLGRVYTYRGDHQNATTEYSQAAEFFKTQNHPRFLEVMGFLAESWVQTGRIDDGLKLATDIYDQYDSSPLGQTLKQNDYKTWAIWRSGIFRRLALALKESDKPYDKDLIKNYLTQSLDFLNNPQGQITWGPADFNYRIDEIQKTLARLS